MSNSPQADNVESGPRPGLPTAMIHKKILDAARNDPDASLTEISNVVSGASVELVERVLENYGDPAERHVGETPDRDADAEPTDSDAEDRSASPDTDASDSTAPSDDADTTPADPVPSAEPEPDSVTDAQHEVPDVAALTETELETLTARARDADLDVDFIPPSTAVRTGADLRTLLPRIAARRRAGRSIPAYTADFLNDLPVHVTERGGERTLVRK